MCDTAHIRKADDDRKYKQYNKDITCLIILLMRFSLNANEVPTLLRTVGGGWPGVTGYSGGNSPVNSPSRRHSNLSSSSFSLIFSCKASLRCFRALYISILAWWRLSVLALSSEEWIKSIFNVYSAFFFYYCYIIGMVYHIYCHCNDLDDKARKNPW